MIDCHIDPTFANSSVASYQPLDRDCLAELGGIQPGAVARVNHRYKRNGKERIHLATEPLTGWVNVEITERRRTTEFIDRMVELADDHYPDADCIRVVVDQLNTHNPAGFYQFFPPDEAQAYLDRFEFHYTPKKGSWPPPETTPRLGDASPVVRLHSASRPLYNRLYEVLTSLDALTSVTTLGYSD